MTSLDYWKLTAVLLIGLILGYGASRAEYMLMDKISGGNEANVLADDVVPEREIPVPNPVLSEESQKLLVDSGESADPVLGDNNAKVTMVEFSDFQCPYCQNYSMATFQQIKKDYIDTGKVKYIFRDLPLDFHPQALDAAKFANCAAEEGKYWEAHDLLFSKQGEWSGNAEAKSVFSGYAGELGLNATSMEQCISDPAVSAEIANDLQTGAQIGANGTPTFFINGEQFVGARPYEQFKEVIDKALSQ